MPRRCVYLTVWILLVRGTFSLAVAQETDVVRPPATRQETLRRQREAKAQTLAPEVVSSAEARVRFLETWRLPRRLFAKGFYGLRPVVGGMPAGSGLVGGGGYIAGYNSHLLQGTTNARYSTRGFSAYDAGILVFPRANSLSPIEGFATIGARDFTALRYFGLGGGSNRRDRATYRREDQYVDVGLRAHAGRFADVDLGMQWLRAGAGPGAGRVSLEDRFDPMTPGFATTSTFLVSGGRVALHLREETVMPSVGLTMELAAHRYDDRSSDAFDFTRVVADVKTHLPLGHRNRILAVRARTSHAIGDDGGVVPFYLMETLGGANTIRGFTEYRFRDTRNLLMNAEYRWEVWTYVDFALFVDAGKVFADAAGLSVDGLKSSYGFGIRGHGPSGMVFRFDFAKSPEGFILHVGSGPSF